jgi:hypothetical protein
MSTMVLVIKHDKAEALHVKVYTINSGYVYWGLQLMICLCGWGYGRSKGLPQSPQLSSKKWRKKTGTWGLQKYRASKVGGGNHRISEDHVLMRSGQRAQCVIEVPVYVEKTQNLWFEVVVGDKFVVTRNCSALEKGRIFNWRGEHSVQE